MIILKHKPIEVRIEKQGNHKFSRKTTAKNMRGWITGYISKYSKEKNSEMMLVFTEILNAYNYFEPENDSKKERIINITLEGWKGDGNIDIYKGFTNNFIIIEHIKDKETEDIKEIKHEVSNINLNKLLFIIKKWTMGESHSCYELANMLGFEWKDLWANRVEDYFPKYYYPIKVLEKIGIISYSGNGKITRIK